MSRFQVKTTSIVINPKKRIISSAGNIADINAGWRYFWAKRGYDTNPPPVSTYQAGSFVLPTYSKDDKSRE